MHDHDGKGNSAMMWMMVICCALPLVILFLGGRSLFSGGYFLPVLIGVLIIGHIWMMFGRHGDKNEKQ